MTFDSFFYDSKETGKTVNTLISLLQPNQDLPKMLFLWGANSSGKTHLLHALEKESCQNVLYTTSDQLSRKLLQAVRKEDVCTFRNTFTNVDILLIDDAQFLVSQWATLDFLYDEIVPIIHQNVIMASDCSPLHINLLRGEGIVLKIDRPALEARKRILRQRMEDLDFFLDDATQHHIASTLTDPRKIKGFLTYLKATQTGKS